MITNILILVVGFALLIFGADILVKGSQQIAKRFQIPDIIIGLTIVSIGTSLPEIIITLTSAISGHTELIIGNAIGSNLCNLLLILGTISMIKPVKIEEDIRKFHLPISILTTVFLFFLANGAFGTGKLVIGHFDGWILLSIFFLYFSHPIYITAKDIWKKRKIDKPKSNAKHISIFSSLLLIILGAIFLKLGGDFVVDNSVAIASRFGIPERIIGLTIIAIGTALPELITSLFAIFKNDTGMAIGNLIGSCMLNICLILGLGAVITPLTFTTGDNMTVVLLTGVSVMVWLFNYTGKKHTISRYNGIMMFTIFILYLTQLIFFG